jgi:hypothetical protein
MRYVMKLGRVTQFVFVQQELSCLDLLQFYRTGWPKPLIYAREVID